MVGADAAGIMQIVRRVHDPELPFVSIGDLGIVRRVEVSDASPHQFTVVITPTFSGCPAYRVIEQHIGAALREAGVVCRVVRELSPPWSPGDVTPAGRAALKANGIAVACGGASRPCCPHCDSADIETVSEFGATACKRLARCLRCREPFEVFK